MTKTQANEPDFTDAEIGRDFINTIEGAREGYHWLADWAPAERYGELITDLLDIAFPDEREVVARREAAEAFARNYLLERDEACGFVHPDDSADPEDERKDSAREIVENVLAIAASFAPPVPSPAYGGVKALEWCDSKSHGGRCLVGRDANGAEIARVYYDANREAATSSRIVAKQAAAQADFERRVLSCLSPVAVEEADAEVDEPFNVLDTIDPEWAESFERDRSTPSPQIGKAGAGPVRDATDAMIEAGLKVDMTNEDEVAFLHNVWHAMVAAHPAGAGPVGEAVAVAADCGCGVRLEHSIGVTTTVARPVEEPGEVERAVAEACKPWEFATGEPPEWDSPLHQVFVAGMTYSERLLAKFLKVQTYEGGDGSEDFDCDATMSLVNIIAAAGLWDKDEHRPAAEAALTETRERLEKREEVLREIARQKKTDELETEYDAETASFEDGYDLCIDRARAAFTGDAQEAGK